MNRNVLAWIFRLAALAVVASFMLWLALAAFGCSRQADAVAPAHPVFVAKADSIGTSMLPTFGVAETVALELCAFSDLKAGDTVVYWHDGGRLWVHHRLEGRDQTGRWVTRGDNNPNIDRGHMTSDEFIGRTKKLRQ